MQHAKYLRRSRSGTPRLDGLAQVQQKLQHISFGGGVRAAIDRLQFGQTLAQLRAALCVAARHLELHELQLFGDVRVVAAGGVCGRTLQQDGVRSTE